MKIEITPFRVIITGLFTIIILVSIWLYLLFTASPNPIVDYVALYNASNKPVNYDESQNAWPIYEQAIAKTHEIPEDVLREALYNDFPNQDMVKIIDKWISENKSSLDLLRQAVEKPYCYITRKGDEGVSIFYTESQEGDDLEYLAEMLSLNCLHEMLNGNIDRAISDCSLLEKMSQQFCKENCLLLDQLLGNSIQLMWINCAYNMAANTNMSTGQLKKLRELTDQAVDGKYVICVDTEKFHFYDELQNYFVNSKNGNGRLVWKCRWDMYYGEPETGWRNVLQSEFDNFMICAFGPTQKEVMDDIDRIIELHRKARLMTPWQIANDKTGVIDEIHAISSKLDSVFRSNDEIFLYVSVCGNSYYTKVQLLALQTVLAIKEFQLAYNRLPQSLAELVEKRYLKTVPLDPFSDGELAYKVDGKSYTLYSFGDNLRDDNGDDVYDFIFWPLEKSEVTVGKKLKCIFTDHQTVAN